MRFSSVLGLVAALVACGGPRSEPTLPAVPMEGSSRDLRTLVGDWEGEFVADSGSRQGTISFRLRGVQDTAYGRVLSKGPPPPPGCTDLVSMATTPRVIGEIALTLAYVNVGGPSVSGWLRPYRDPEAGCWMDTWFEGTITGDTLEGMYFSHPADTVGTLRLGTWWVARQR